MSLKTIRINKMLLLTKHKLPISLNTYRFLFTKLLENNRHKKAHAHTHKQPNTTFSFIGHFAKISIQITLKFQTSLSIQQS